MRRKVIPELLDEDLGTPEEIAASLADLRHINDWFGGTRTTATLIERVARRAGNRELSLLEVAAGNGDVPRHVSQMLGDKGVRADVTLLDRMGSHLPQSGARSVAGDALALPFRDGSFDIVSCSLFAHHLEGDELRGFVQEGLRVCRHAVLINDLIRSRLHLALVYAGLPLFRSRLTWHDAPASVKRAYTPDEMREMLKGVPGAEVTISRHYLYRMGVVIEKRHSAVSSWR
jgi:ubiquinone/menaquinone biosynthesis C-methylase UbiE